MSFLPSYLFVRNNGVLFFRRLLAARVSSKPKKEKAMATVVPLPEKPAPVPPTQQVQTVQPQQVLPPIDTHVLMNFPLCVDHKTSQIATILGRDRVVEHGLKRYPSVGTVMRDTQTPQQIFLLNRWREKKTVEVGGPAEFQQYVQRIKSEGERLHNCLRLFLSSEVPEKQLPLVDALVPLWASFRPVLDKISAVRAVETTVHHRPLGYTGIADCVAEIDGEVVVIDWKVSERQRTNLAQTYDTPIQIIAYIGALNAHYAWSEAQKQLPPAPINLPTKDGIKQEKPQNLFVPRKLIRHGLAVIGYRDGSPAHIHVMDESSCEMYWQKWLEKVQTFWAKKLSSMSSSSNNNTSPGQHNPQ